jgi:hypothetical protein
MNDPADRSTGLLVFGLLTILGGVLCGLFVPLVLLNSRAATHDPAVADPSAQIPAVMAYSLAAVALIALGVGSVRARRWACALLALAGWSALVIGAFSVGTMVFLIPGLARQVAAETGTLSPERARAVLWTTTGFMAAFFVLIPAAWAAFYSAPATRATCARRNPQPSWTDPCPLPVLAPAVWSALSAAGLLLGPLFQPMTLPAFGFALTGWPATAAAVSLAVALGFVACGLYHRHPSAWLAALALTLLAGLSQVLTILRTAADSPATPEFLAGTTAAWTLGAAGYLIFCRRFFRSVP